MRYTIASLYIMVGAVDRPLSFIIIAVQFVVLRELIIKLVMMTWEFYEARRHQRDAVVQLASPKRNKKRKRRSCVLRKKPKPRWA